MYIFYLQVYFLVISGFNNIVIFLLFFVSGRNKYFESNNLLISFFLLFPLCLCSFHNCSHLLQWSCTSVILDSLFSTLLLLYSSSPVLSLLISCSPVLMFSCPPLLLPLHTCYHCTSPAWPLAP